MYAQVDSFAPCQMGTRFSSGHIAAMLVTLLTIGLAACAIVWVSCAVKCRCSQRYLGVPVKSEVSVPLKSEY